MKTKQEAVKDLLNFIPHLRHAASSAIEENPESKIMLGILAISADNKSGVVSCRFEMDSFLEDLSIILEEDTNPEVLKEKDLEASAERFLQVNGLK